MSLISPYIKTVFKISSRFILVNMKNLSDWGTFNFRCCSTTGNFLCHLNQILHYTLWLVDTFTLKCAQFYSKITFFFVDHETCETWTTRIWNGEVSSLIQWIWWDMQTQCLVVIFSVFYLIFILITFLAVYLLLWFGYNDKIAGSCPT